MLKVYKEVGSIPDIWDKIFEDTSYILKKQLNTLERCNPCNQKYFIINDRSAFISYELKLNIFTYSNMRLNYKVNIVGIPCSVSKAGYVLNSADITEFEEYIKKEKKSFIILNSEDNFLSKLFINGETLPTCRIKIIWNSFDEYMSNLRSHYRYRVNKALKKGNKIRIEKLSNNGLFDEKMYSLYQNVYEKSQYKLEKLSIDFFREIGTFIYVFYIGEEPVAFVQLSEMEKELYFLFGGIDYSVNREYDLYMNMLLFILRHGIENKYLWIDMGQTAEDAKMKLGCSQYKRYMHIYHPNRVIRFIIRKFSKKLSYSGIHTKFNILKRGK